MGKTSKNEFWAYDYSKLYIRSMDNSSIKAYPLAVEKISNLYIGVQFIYIMYSNGTLYSISKQTSEVKEIAIPTIYRPLLENHLHRPKRKPMGIHLPKQPTFAQEQFYTAMGGHQPEQ